MKIVFIRHGEPDKTEVDRRGFIGQGRDMAPLTEFGIKEAEGVSLSPLLEGSQVIVSSPYTRALQTAAIISKNTGLDIKVEVADGEKCERCWMYSTTVGEDKENPTICSRCSEALK